MTIHVCKVNLYMKYQSAVEILNLFACGYCLKMSLNTVLDGHPPFLLQFENLHDMLNICVKFHYKSMSGSFSRK